MKSDSFELGRRVGSPQPPALAGAEAWAVLPGRGRGRGHEEAMPLSRSQEMAALLQLGGGCGPASRPGSCLLSYFGGCQDCRPGDLGGAWPGRGDRWRLPPVGPSRARCRPLRSARSRGLGAPDTREPGPGTPQPCLESRAGAQGVCQGPLCGQDAQLCVVRQGGPRRGTDASGLRFLENGVTAEAWRRRARQAAGRAAQAPRERRLHQPTHLPRFARGQPVVRSARGSSSLAGCRGARARAAVPVRRPAGGHPWVAPGGAAGAGPGAFGFGLSCRHLLTASSPCGFGPGSASGVPLRMRTEVGAPHG